jgi:NADP-dependent 3-hydroxy acid dehydrogenase YdfG
MGGIGSQLFDLSGKVACVTGASSGLGKRAATVLAEAGATVIGVARREAELRNWQSSAGTKAGYIVHDLSDRTKLPNLLEVQTFWSMQLELTRDKLQTKSLQINGN